MKDKKDSKETAVYLNQLAQDVRKWVASPDGQKQIEKVLDNSEKTISELREARNIDSKSIYEPFTL